MTEKTLQNPLLCGFYPDPSICRVGDDFYMVTSSFSYFPGVPIFHSTNLRQWEQIGHVLDRPEQLPLDADQISGGIFAPTIRYHEGTFYMITTNIDHGGNFIVTASNPAGPWSEPHWIENAEGIDPSLFFDRDNKAYYTGTGRINNRQMIWLSEIDLKQMKLVGEKHFIWGGALVDCWAPEAPHLYEKDGYYYLMIAEGGTEHYHAVTIARAKQITGPYIGYEGNPILTHRHLGMMYPICNTGHADLVELKDGSWYMVLLASRIYGGYHKNMGRETFIAPVVWEDGWPVVSPCTGKVEWTYQAPDLPDMEVSSPVVRDDFTEKTLAYPWNFLGTPYPDLYQIKDSCLHLRTVEKRIFPLESNEKSASFGQNRISCRSFVGRRQQHKSFEASAKMNFIPEGNESAGLVILQNNFNQLRVELVAREKACYARLVKGVGTISGNLFDGTASLHFKEEIVGEKEIKSGEVCFFIHADGQKHSFYVKDKENLKVLGEEIDGGFLGSESAGGFVGAYIGMFASGNGTDTGRYAAFDWFDYTGKEDREESKNAAV